MMDDNLFVAEYPDVCGGYPVIRGTRIPVRLVVEFSRRGMLLDDLLDVWPTVTADQLRGALAFYARTPRRVDEDITRHAHVECAPAERRSA